MSNWTEVTGQSGYNEDDSGTATGVAASMPSNATAGNVVCVGVWFTDLTGVPPTISDISDENGKTYTETPNSPAPNSSHTTSNVFLFYLLVPSGAGKTVTVHFSKGGLCGIRLKEFAMSGGTIAFDSDAVCADNASGSTINTPTVSVGSSDDLCFSFAISADQVNAVNSPWTGDISGANLVGTGWILGASSNTAVNMTNNSNVQYASAAMSFKNSSGGTSLTPTVASLVASGVSGINDCGIFTRSTIRGQN